MTPILIYILKTNGLLLVLYLFYKLFLQKETFVHANRIYFLGGIALSLLLPLITYTSIVQVEVEPLDTMAYAYLLDDTSLESIAVEESIWTAENLITSLSYLYISLTAMSILWLGYKVIKLVRHIHNLPVSQVNDSLRIDEQSSDAYSFMNWVVLPKDYETMDQVDVVLAHEQVHVQQRHSIDLIIIEALKHLFWFNPALYFLQREINLNLEYIVDEEITRHADTYTYQRALVLYETNKLDCVPIVNTFGTSDLKKRIIMLNNPKSTNMKRLKYLLLTPVLGGFFFLFQTEVKAQYIEVSGKDKSKVTSQDNTTPEDISKISEEARRLSEEVERLGKEAEALGVEAVNVGREAKNIGEEAKSVGAEAKKIGKEAKAISKEANKIAKDIPYVVNGQVYTYSEYVALGNPVSSIANVDILDAKTATARYGNIGKDGAVELKLRPETEWTGKGSFMDNAVNYGGNAKTSFSVAVVDKDGTRVVEGTSSKSSADAEKDLMRKLKEKEEAQAKLRLALRERSDAERQVILAKQEKQRAEIDKRSANVERRKAEIENKRTEAEKRRASAEGRKAEIEKDIRERSISDKFVYYVDGKQVAESELESFYRKMKSVRVYSREAANKELGYTGNKTVLEYTLKTDEDYEKAARVEEITKRYKEKVSASLTSVKSDSFKGLVFINNVEKSNDDLKTLDAANVVTMEVLKGSAAADKYGDKGVNGVILIKTKQ
ncbi:BlaR1 peptidase M56 [Myroides marinus]|uniref:BlaR1 peptidase M56 n=1 Tax=Myroides marinus TaxID=703342 RepID=A0A1H6RMC9_9FLAO|nr:M56 family metallopeptidase [Myroides marinus]SEI53697.1 BlaR1 peptidase M56 [Myroides marinus]